MACFTQPKKLPLTLGHRGECKEMIYMDCVVFGQDVAFILFLQHSLIAVLVYSFESTIQINNNNKKVCV